MKAKVNLSRTLVVLAVGLLVAVAVALFGVGLRTAEPQTTPITYYKVQALGTFYGSTAIPPYSSPYGINDFGHVVGEASLGGNLYGWTGYAVHAFLYDSTNGMKGLGSLGGPDSAASAINNSGQVAGSATTTPTETNYWYGNQHAFLYEIGAMKDLGTLGTFGGGYSNASDINDFGQVVGSSYDDSSGQRHAFLWKDDGDPNTADMKDLGTLGGSYSGANAMNDSGQVVGQSSTSSGEVHAFLWKDDGDPNTADMKDLGTLGGSSNTGGASSSASDISNSGQVVGYAYNSSGEQHAFLYEKGEMKDLGTLPGGTTSAASAINDSGEVFGSSSGSYFLYQNGEMIDLSTRLLPDNNGDVWNLGGGPLNYRWNSDAQTDMNNKGQIVVDGWRLETDGYTYKYSALLLTPTSDIPPEDTEAPSPPTITSPPNDSYDTDGSFSVSGSAEASSTVELFEGTTSKGTTTADSSSGAWSIDLSGLSDGSHTYTAKAKDAASNTSSASNSVSVTVDKTPPKVVDRSVVPQEDATGVAPGDDVKATFSEGMQDASVKSSFKLYKKGTTSALGASVSYEAASRKATLVPSANLRLGTTYKAVVSTGAKDMAGNSLDQDDSLSGSQQKVWFFKVGN